MNIYQEAVRLLEKKENFVFATIVNDIGSTPRSKGTKMIVREDGSIFGTIGGGSMEANCIKEAGNVILDKVSKIHTFNLTNKDAAKLEMICGGKGEILIDYVSCDNKNNHEVYKRAAEDSTNNKKGWIVTGVSLEDREIYYINNEKNIYGEENQVQILREELNKVKRVTQLHEKSIGHKKIYIDSVFSQGTAFIFGGGHVSKDVASVLSMLEFKTVVIDDREDFANKERFPQSEVVVIDSFTNMPDLDVDDDSYILIITRGHMHDSTVLEWALKTDAYYVGMIGSKRKVLLTYDKLKNNGFTEKDFDRVCAPIGIKLKAQTPAEIAVSIAAELINYRADKEGKN